MHSISVRTGLGRLKSRKEFLYVAGARRKWAMPGMVVQVSNRPSPALPSDLIRVGFTASKKVGNAVARNRVKRRLRACVDEILPHRAQPGLDFVVIGRAGTISRPYAALRQDLTACLRKLGVARDEASEHG